MEEQVYAVLNDLMITYQAEKHPAVWTVADAEGLDLKLDGVGCKTIFLTDRRRCFLYTTAGEKRADLRALREKLGCGRLTLGSERELLDRTGLYPGCVSPFGVLKKDGGITVLIDQDLLEHKLILHPNVNTASISIECRDLLKVIDHFNVNYMLL